MSAGDEDRRRNEIIIVRRRGGDSEHGHHGGAWKIAYADFMTAMMALFLVMWLVNATSKDTRAQVASYFNPIKLSDTISSPRGLNEMQPGEQARKKPPEDAVKKPDKSGSSSVLENQDAKATFSSVDFFNDPHGVLAKLAAKNADHRATKSGTQAGVAYRDPFDPAFRQQFELAKPTQKSPDLNKGAGARKTDWSATVKSTSEKKAEATDRGASPALQVSKPSDAPDKSTAAQLLGQIMDRSLSSIDKARRSAIGVDVTKEGVVLSLTDRAGFSMFDVGVAVPTPSTVVLVDQIAAAIKKNHKGTIVISGHTDALPFAGGDYGNWRLSTDRAHAFYHMLARGGVAMARVRRVEGFAATKPKVQSDLTSPLNRRVEITLRLD